MSPSSSAWTVVGAVLALAVVALLVRKARTGDLASRWLAVAAVAWGAAFLAQGASAGAITPAVIQLTLTDLLALLGLPAMVIALFRLARRDDSTPGTVPANAAETTGARWRVGTGRIPDGSLLGLAVFCVGWITVLRLAYSAAAVGAGTFIVDLIHPAADLIAAGGTLGLAALAGRRGLMPYLALCAATLGDFLAVQARAGGSHPGIAAQLAWLAALCLLGLSALAPGDTATLPAADDHERPRLPVATVVALGSAGVAAVVTLIFAIVTWGHSGPVPLLAGAALMLALVARIAGLLRQAAAASVLAAEADSQFHQLADRTSDAVLLCDAAGLVGYASKAVAQFGYTPERLTGARLMELVHPDDLPHVLQAARQARASRLAPAGNLACRVRSSDGTWRHVQATLSRYSQADRTDLLLVTARDVSDQVALRRQVTHLTFHDGLTGLPNRSYLEERAKDLLARHREAAQLPEQTGAIFVDLDGFTAINDSVGHGAGDLLLAQAGRRLRSLVPAHDTAARWGGDEFAVLIEGAASPQEIVDVAERLAGAIAAEPFRVAGRDIPITASVGVAFADPEVAEHLLRNADLALSRAKDAGGGRVEVFAAHMHADVIRRLELATDLRAAIEQGSLGIEYQPVVELSTARVASVEALVRWTRDGEYIQPAEFLGIAEDSGLIVPLGQWVLGQACQQVAQWRAAGWLVGLSVNLSRRQVSAAGFAESVLTTLDDSGLSRSALTLEVTERVLIEIGAPILDGLARLRQLGVRLAIDDFGTGYASLAYLRQLPVDIIKIDPSFVAGLGIDGTLAMLTRTIVQVGHDLGIEIVAEGIERPEQLELLRAMGCGLGQGYLVARPMAADAIESMAPELMMAHPADRGGEPSGGPDMVRLQPKGDSGPNEDEAASAATT
ncbi:MAG: putative bifunctional diguanylate cyclase/phosphodiesterase [Streptosporangiaceae bacterium]